MRFILLLTLPVLWCAAAETSVPLRFDFTAAAASPGVTKVDQLKQYSVESGFGYDMGPHAEGKPFFFSANVPEGNYAVTAVMGDQSKACNTTVKAESRRLMLEKVESAAGHSQTRTFHVNVRNFMLPAPALNAPGGDRVRLNNRETGVLHWDNKLTLEFNGPSPCLRTLELKKVVGWARLLMFESRSECGMKELEDSKTAILIVV